MSLIQITAYKCKWCGKVMENPRMHEFENFEEEENE